MTTFWFQNKYFGNNIAKQLLILFVSLSAIATSVASTTTKITETTNTSESALGITTTPSPQIPALPAIFAWGHNTKYSTILYDESVIVKASTFVDVKYPKNAASNDDYTIIGIYSSVSDKFDAAIGIMSTEDLSVYLIEGGIGYNFTAVRFVSKALNDVEFNLQIFGVNV